MQAPPVAREPKPGATLYIYTARKAYPSHDALRKPHRERERERETCFQPCPIGSFTVAISSALPDRDGYWCHA